MPTVDVDLRQLAATLQAASPSGADVRRLVRALGASARSRWIELAQDALKSTSRDYVQGIGQPVVAEDGHSVRLELTGQIPNMVEQGWAAHDLRDTVLGGPATRVSKEGNRYVRVPFRHGTPGSSGRNVGKPMPRAVHAAAKALAPTLREGLGRPGARSILEPQASTAHRLQIGMAGASKQVERILAKKEQEWHKSSVYSGMIREVAAYAKTQQNKFMTFRTISDKPGADPRSWLHPGIKARNFAEKVRDHVRQVADEIAAKVLG
jgi:hypothetical protein